MKKLLLILLSVFLISCNPFISKELRKKNKCNRKLEKLTEKCPELLQHDTLIVPFEVIVPKIEIKDSLIVEVDTLELIKYVPFDKIKYVVKAISLDTLVLDSLYKLKISLSNGVFSYDIEIYQRTVKDSLNVPIKVVQTIKLTKFEKFLNWLNNMWHWLLWLLLAIPFYLIYRFCKKYFDKMI